MRAGNGISDLHLALSHAMYEGFPEFTYHDRDWEHYRKTKEPRVIEKKRKHTEHDIGIYSMFSQTWGSTALGFNGLGGAAITDAYVIILHSYRGVPGFCVYFGGRFAYYIENPNQQFFNDIQSRNMASVEDAKTVYDESQ